MRVRKTIPDRAMPCAFCSQFFPSVAAWASHIVDCTRRAMDQIQIDQAYARKITEVIAHGNK
jgi:hypothetical protein